VFEDDNAATHLIKNSLAGSDEKKRNELLSMRYPISRWLRDDITCT
jgi:pyruvate dehydrogenase phosphatase